MAHVKFQKAFWINYIPENATCFAPNVFVLEGTPTVQIKGVRSDQFKFLCDFGQPGHLEQWLNHRYLWRTLALMQTHALVLEDTHELPADFLDATENIKGTPDLIMLGNGAYIISPELAARADRKTNHRDALVSYDAVLISLSTSPVVHEIVRRKKGVV
jgi:hypothetical protein